METVSERTVKAELELRKIQKEINEHQKIISRLQRKMVKVYSMNNSELKTSPLSNLESATEMAKKICDKINITYEEMQSRTRIQEVVAARQSIWYVFHKEYGMTFTSIGKIFNKDHATIIHGVRKLKDELYLYQKFDNKTITMVYLEKVCDIMGIQMNKLD
tara:strand:- start:906 stop:1388 length:483 start_codon:yes stop_codon:yes gene_type:complete